MTAGQTRFTGLKTVAESPLAIPSLEFQRKERGRNVASVRRAALVALRPSTIKDQLTSCVAPGAQRRKSLLFTVDFGQGQSLYTAFGAPSAIGAIARP